MFLNIQIYIKLQCGFFSYFNNSELFFLFFPFLDHVRKSFILFVHLKCIYSRPSFSHLWAATNQRIKTSAIIINYHVKNYKTQPVIKHWKIWRGFWGKTDAKNMLSSSTFSILPDIIYLTFLCNRLIACLA